MKDKNPFIDYHIKEVVGLDNEEIDQDVNYYTPFCIVFKDENNKQIQINLDHDNLIKLFELIKPISESDKSLNEIDKLYGSDNLIVLLRQFFKDHDNEQGLSIEDISKFFNKEDSFRLKDVINIMLISGEIYENKPLRFRWLG